MSGVLSALQLVCGAGAQTGPVSHWSGERNMLMVALQRAEDWMWAIVFKLPGDFGVLHFKDYSFFGSKVPLSSENQAHFSFHNVQTPNQLCFLTKPGLQNVP